MAPTTSESPLVAAWPGERRQALYLHVGLPKSGTTFLQALLAENRDRLRQAGFIYPFVRREGMFHAAVELRSQHEQWGLPPALVDGTWQRLLDRIRGFDGAGIISHELLAGAPAPLVERVARDTEGLDLHVVVTARDLGRQVTAHWQEQVKNGRRWSFEQFRSELFGPTESEDEEDGFWRSQDLGSVLRRWSAVVPPGNVHVVTVPRSGTDPMELWRRFGEAVGLAPGALELELPPRGNESLGSAQVALLRQVLEALDGRLHQPEYAQVVKRRLAQTLLGAIESPRPVTPADLRAELSVTAREWAEEVVDRGYSVHGHLDELIPGPPHDEAAERHPDDVTAEELFEGVPTVLAELVLEIAALRSRLAEPRGPEAGPPPRRRLGLPGRSRSRRADG
jgi:hypothetical protein